jgi:hypothetical protein
LSIINQLAVTFPLARLIHLTVIMSIFESTARVNDMFCKVFSYFLTCFIRIAFWLASFVALERSYTALFLNKQWLKQPYIARRLVVATFVIVFLSSSYELAFVRSFSAVEQGYGAMCVTQLLVSSQSTWIFIHQVVFVTHLLTPLLINICCTCTIIIIVINTKMNIREQTQCKFYT